MTMVNNKILFYPRNVEDLTNYVLKTAERATFW